MKNDHSPRKVLMLLENGAYQNDYRPRREARTMLAAGYQVSVISPRPNSGGPFHQVWEGVHLYQYPPIREPGGALGYLLEYGYATLVMFLCSIYVWLSRGFDVIHAHNPPDTMFLVAAPYKLLGKRFVFDHHDLAPEMYCARFGPVAKPAVYRALIALEKLTCRMADRVIATNESYREVEIERHGVLPERIAVVRNGPEDVRIPPVQPFDELRPAGHTVLGYLGRIGPQDGVDRMIVALAHLIHGMGRREVLCIVVGDGDALPAIRAQAVQLRVADYIHFTGWVTGEETIRRYLATADICLVPEPSTPYNDRSTVIKLLEYMALGKPSVAFDLPEHRFTAKDASLYARPNDETDFARKIAHLMDHPEERSRLGAIGQKRIESELAWPYQAESLVQAYRTLFGEAYPASPAHLQGHDERVQETAAAARKEPR